MLARRDVEITEDLLQKKIRECVIQMYTLKSPKKQNFKPVEDRIQYAGAVYDYEEVQAMIDAILDGWFGMGKRANMFERRLAEFLGVKKAHMTNSGSSANLLTIAALLSPQLDEDKRLKPRDEVITPALTFPTTINPIIQNGLVPVLVDAEIYTYNIRIDDLQCALSKETKAILVPHTLGNPAEIDKIMEFAQDHELYVIEDACDALGSKFDGKYVGTFGTFGTFSFYPAHQITTGEGGAVVTGDTVLSEIVRSLRDWGRACTMSVCDPFHCPDRECPKSRRGEASMTESGRSLPGDYDKRYQYVNIGYNLKPTEIQAAMGVAQLGKLPAFIEKRKKNFEVLYNGFSKYDQVFVLPRWLPKSEPCWFAFPLTIKEEAPFTREQLVQWLTSHNIEVKMLFSGNIIRHPAYKAVPHRVASDLSNSDYVMRNSFFIGLYPGLDADKLDFVLEMFREFIEEKRRR